MKLKLMPVQTGIRLLCAAGLLTGIAAQAQFVEPAVHHDAGDGITGVFEGWFPNADGSFSIELGYYNRNVKQEVDVPVGPSNKIEPGGPDMGQPTHFYPGRVYGNFTVRVPKEFGTGKLQWTITVNGKTNVVPLNLKTDWQLSPFQDADENTGPMVSFSPFEAKAPAVQGPIPVKGSLKATVGEPLALTAYVADDDIVSPAMRKPKVPVTVHWTVFREPENGSVKIENSRPEVVKIEGALPPKMKFMGKAATTATFSEPGQYVIGITANDATGEGGGGFECCWTNGQINVTVAGPRAGSLTGGN